LYQRLPLPLPDHIYGKGKWYLPRFQPERKMDLMQGMPGMLVQDLLSSLVGAWSVEDNLEAE